MSDIHNFVNILKENADQRLEDFKIIPIDSISNISEDAYLDKPYWLGGDKEFVCLFIDLDGSAKKSFKSHAVTMAKIYDYFTKSIVDVLNHPKIGADYIDIKGDGAFGLFEGPQASFKALYCAITFKTFFENHMQAKFTKNNDEPITCKFGIHKDKVLVRKIGKRGEGNYNEVWAGRVVNNAAKLSTKAKDIDLMPTSPIPILISEDVYSDFERNKEYGFYNCCDGDRPIKDEQRPMFFRQDELTDETLGDHFYFTQVRWCPNCANDYMNLID